MIIDSLEKWWVVIVGGHRPWTGNPVLDQYQGMREGIPHGSNKNCSPFFIGQSINQLFLWAIYTMAMLVITRGYIANPWIPDDSHGRSVAINSWVFVKIACLKRLTSKNEKVGETYWEMAKINESIWIFRKFNLVDFNIQSCLIRTPVSWGLAVTVHIPVHCNFAKRPKLKNKSSNRICPTGCNISS